MSAHLISAEDLCRHYTQPDLVILDCRFDLMHPAAGHQRYQEGHIPGAIYMDLDLDLSGPPITDQGRHPLPSATALCELFGRCGINRHSRVVVYDDGPGAIAARAWWLLRYLGHPSVRLLDGGFRAWLAAGGPQSQELTVPVACQYEGQPCTDRVVTLANWPDGALLVDVREPGRYLGEFEPLDPVAGHIPGAVNRYWQRSLDAEGRFLPDAELKVDFARLYGDVAPENVVFYCGSGVTACHGLLAACHAGYPLARLYAGSWSDWCHDSRRPVARGLEDAAGRGIIV